MEFCICQQAEKPKLEIPDCSSKLPPGNGLSPRSINGLSPRSINGLSPRSIHGFPLSPQSPEVLPLVKGFQGLDTRLASETVADKGGRIRISVGEYVLVRCNQSKWLLGYVRRSSRTGLRIWVGVAHTLVEVPFELLGTHLLKLNSPSSSSTSSIDSLEVGPSGQVLAPFHCVRPAHLSHRKLYQPLGVLPSEDKRFFVKAIGVAAPRPASYPAPIVRTELSRSASLPTSFRGESVAETEILPAFVRNKAIAAELPSMMKRPLWPQQPKTSSASSYIGPSTLGLSKLKLSDSQIPVDKREPFSDLDNKRAWVTVIEKGIKKQGFLESSPTPSNCSET